MFSVIRRVDRNKIDVWRGTSFCVLVILLCLTCSGWAAERTASVALGEGQIGRFWWSASIESPEDASERRQGAVCLSITMLEPPIGMHRGGGSEVATCGLLMAGEPLIETYTGGLRGRRRTAVAMLFPGEAKTLYLKLQGRPGRSFRLGVLSQKELGSIGSAPLAFFAHGYRGRFCIRRLTAYGDDGHVVARTGTRLCRQ